MLPTVWDKRESKRSLWRICLSSNSAKRLVQFRWLHWNMRLFQLLLICVLMTLSQSMNCRKCSGSDGLCSSESDNGYQQSCSSAEKCWFEHGEVTYFSKYPKLILSHFNRYYRWSRQVLSEMRKRFRHWLLHPNIRKWGIHVLDFKLICVPR